MAQHTILAVDDEMDILLIVKTALEGEGYKVVTAANGFDALATAEDIRPDLILLDIMMPEMDGFEVLDQLRRNENTMHIPIIMLTGVSEILKKKEALDKGITYYINKPFDYQTLVSKVKMAIEEKDQDPFSL
ncbi:MAG: hypothetical protein Kow0059_04450 [Candidatus Sumerlaeia bacterium]